MYRFKLEALLIHRRHQEDACQKELAQARRRLSDEREKLERKKREKQESLKKLQTKKKREHDRSRYYVAHQLSTPVVQRH